CATYPSGSRWLPSGRAGLMFPYRLLSMLFRFLIGAVSQNYWSLKCSLTELFRAQKTLQAIQAWPNWDEVALCAQQEYGLTPEEFQDRLTEYQRFMALCSAYSGIGMTSDEVDQLWHSHILHTALYAAFCSTIIGHRVDHLPCSSYALYGVNNSDTDCTTCKL